MPEATPLQRDRIVLLLMYARLIESASQPARVDELNRVIRRELVTALRTARGFCGALNLLDRETGAGLLLVLWETDEEAARPLGPLLTAVEAVAELAAGDLSASTVWEVSARG